VSRGAGSDDRTPILVGAGQLTQRDVAPAEALEPLAMMEVVARRAADDAGAGAALLARVDSLAVVNVFCWPYANPPRLLAERLGIHPDEKLYTTVGGSTPQWLVNETAARIASGRVRVALLTGAEAVRTVMQARKARLRLRWSGGGDGPPSMVGDARDGTSEHEVAQGFMLPTQIYPLFENALRARAGRDLDRHRGMLGELCSRLSAVAAANPYAWFREARTADEIATVTPSNRMVAFPYPKLMNAIIEVDQAAGVLMTSVAEARALGIPRERWVHLWGTGQAHDRWFVSDRVDYVSSPAIREAGRQALDAAGIAIDRVDHLDLYSCFPAAVQIGRDMLGIAADDPRPLTVTGGLPYFGGGATTTRCTPSPRRWRACGRAPARSASSPRSGGTSPSTPSASTARRRRTASSRARIRRRTRRSSTRRPHPSWRSGRRGRPRSRPTRSSTIATARRCGVWWSDGSRTAGGSSPAPRTIPTCFAGSSRAKRSAWAAA
jgi:acetyl-CoA C-acetyltransferase